MQIAYYFLLLIFTISKVNEAQSKPELAIQQMLSKCECPSGFEKKVYGLRYYYPMCFKFHEFVTCENAAELDIPSFQPVHNRLIQKPKVTILW